MSRQLRILGLLPIITSLLIGCAAEQSAGPGAVVSSPEQASLSAQPEASPTIIGAIPTEVALALNTDYDALLDQLAPERVPWEFGGYGGSLITTPHYRIHSTLRYDRVDEVFPAFMEHALSRYRTTFGPLPEPRRPMTIYMFQDRRHWLAKTRQLLPNQYAQFSNLGRGGFATQGVANLYYIDYRANLPRATFAIAAHEGWHQYTQVAFDHPLPIWLEEGIATYMEGLRASGGEIRFEPKRNWERRGALSRAIRRGELIPMEELLSRPPHDFLEEGKGRLLTYYGQVWALTHFLLEGENGKYADGLATAVEDAASGQLLRKAARNPQVLARGGRSEVYRSRTGPWIAYAYFNEDLEAFEQEYLEFARRLTQRSSRP